MEDKITRYFNMLRKFSQIILNRVANQRTDFDFDLKLSQLKAIAAFNEKRPFSMKQLAGNSMVKLPNMTTMVDSLIRDGIAERMKDPSDRRKVMVRLTQKGTKIRTQFLSNRRKTALSIFSNLSNQEKTELIDSLDKVCKLLEKSITSDINQNNNNK